MSTNISPTFGTNYLHSTIGASSLSIALIGPDPQKRRDMAAALAEDGRTSISEFETYPRRADEFQWLAEQSFDVILLDLDSDPDVVLELVGKVGDSATVMVYSVQSDTRLAVRYMRAGAREYLLLPLEDGVVAEALDRTLAARSERTHPARESAGNLFVFVCAKGGCGATTVACNLAIALASNSDQRTLLIDLALPIGDAALSLGISAQYSTEDAIRSAGRLDASLLNELLVKHRSGLFVLPAPSNFPGIEGCEDAIEKLVAVARRQFDHVIVDVGSRIDLMHTSLFRQASTVYLVTLSGISELRNSNRLISQFFPAGGPNLEIIVNRFESRLLGGVKEDDIAKALGSPVRWTAPEDREAALEMQYGETGAATTRMARLGLEMAAAITGRPIPEEKKKDVRPKTPRRSALADSSGDAADPGIRVAPAAPPATPEIHWQPPASIVFGEELSADQLNAEASVAGTLVYTPAPGTLLPAGSHQLYVSFIPEDSKRYTPAQAAVPLEVEKSLPAVSWPSPEPIPYATLLSPEQLCATASLPGHFDYSPAHGELLPAGTHALSVKFTPDDSDNFLVVEAETSLIVEKAVPEVAWASPDPITYGAPLTATQLCAVANVPGKFQYSQQPGAVLAAGVHTLIASFLPDEPENYAPVETSVELIVDKASPLIDWPSPDPIANGTDLSEKQLCATASVLGRFDYSPGFGEILAAGTHTLSVTFTPSDSDNYARAEAAVPLHVARATPVVEWSNPNPIRYGTRLSAKQLCATASVQGRFQYTPALGEVLAAGTHTLSAMFIPADGANYAPVRAAVSLEVAKAIPAIEWPAPNAIRCDVPLGERQLCASSPQPGTFDYTPPAGHTLPAGSHMLSVTFTPADAANYATTHASVSIKVVEKPASAPAPAIADPRNPQPARASSNGFSSSPGANNASARSGVSLNAEKSDGQTRPAPQHLRHGKPLRPLTPDAEPDVAPPSQAPPLRPQAARPRLETSVPPIDTRPESPLLSDFEKPEPRQAAAEPRAEALRNSTSLPVARAEKLSSLDRDASLASQPLPPVPVISQAPDPLDWLMAPDPVHPEPQPTAKRSGSKKKWIFAGAGGASLLAAAIFLVPALHSRGNQPVKAVAAPLPASPATASIADNAKPSPSKPSPTQAAQQDASAATPDSATSPDTTDSTPDQAKPTAGQAELMRNQLNAQSRIPQAQNQTAPNAPPPANFSTADAAGMGGNGAIGNVFAGKGPAVVAAPPRGPLVISPDAAMRLLTQKNLPVYPLIARQAHVSGTVQMEVSISTAGTVKDVRVINGNPMLRVAASDAVHTWRFRPYLVNNQPVEIKTMISVSFSLDR